MPSVDARFGGQQEVLCGGLVVPAPGIQSYSEQEEVDNFLTRVIGGKKVF